MMWTQRSRLASRPGARLTAVGTASILALVLALAAQPTLAAKITVNTELDVATADGFCSLREAIAAANTDSALDVCPAGDGPDRIEFELTTPAIISLTDDLPAITAPLSIRGPGWLDLEIDGNDQFRPLLLESPTGEAWLLVEDLTLLHGRAPAGDDPHGGGALLDENSGVAHFRRVRFINNTAANGGGGVAALAGTGVTLVDCYFLSNLSEGATGGGGLYLAALGQDSRVLRSTFAANFAFHENGAGGGIRVESTNLTVESTTFSGNYANLSGGGLFAGVLAGSADLVIRDSTIARNVASADSVGTGGGGIATLDSNTHSLHLILENTVVAENDDLQADPSLNLLCEGALFELTATSSFVESNDGCESFLPDGNPNVDGNFVGTEIAPLDARLRDLDDVGGLTPTHAPSFGPLSPLIDQGSCGGSVSDQRGYGDVTSGRRPVDLPTVPDAAGGDACDIGALEVRGDPGADPLVFADGFESGNNLMWIVEVP